MLAFLFKKNLDFYFSSIKNEKRNNIAKCLSVRSVNENPMTEFTPTIFRQLGRRRGYCVNYTTPSALTLVDYYPDGGVSP